MGSSNEVKDLICKMICVDAATRITVDEVLEHPWITHKAITPSKLVTAPEKMKKIVQAKRIWRHEMGAMLHLMALSRMEHLALKHGILQQEHIDEVHKLHKQHSTMEKSDPASKKEALAGSNDEVEQIKTSETE